MKKIKILGLLIIALIGFNSCETEDDVVFVAQVGELSFTNSFSPEYVLTPAAAGNLGERFTWNTPNVGVPTNQTFELQKSLIGDFSDAEAIASTTTNEIAVTIGNLLGYAAQLGLDNDPGTEAPNTGQVSFRIKAVTGSDGLETFSPTQALTLVLPEDTGNNTAVCDFDQLFLVGAGVTFTGWGWDTVQQVTCSGTGVYTANIDFTNNVDGDGNFRFFTVETDWGSGQNFTFFGDDGYTIDPMFENAMDDDNNFLFTGPSGLYALTIDTVNKEITLGDPSPNGTCDLDQLWIVGAGVPDAGWGWDSPIQLVCEGDSVYSGYVNLQNNGGADNNFRFFTIETDWGSGQNFPFYVDAGYTIDANFEDAADDDNNFAFVGTTGAYFLTIDTINKTITLE